MEPKPPSKLRIVLMWLLMLGVILFWVVFWIWKNPGHAPAEESPDESGTALAHVILSLLAGGFFLVCGVAGYLVTIFTGCLTFNHQRPAWAAAKRKLYFVNIVVTVLLALGLGFILAAFATPLLVALGLDKGLAFMVPVMLMVAAVQMVELWVLIWMPVETYIIRKRLAVSGVTPEQLQTATLVGLSNPASTFAKRFGRIEEDVGALWISPEQLVYRGDGEQFDFGREQIVSIEQKADNRSTSVLSGMAHVILHVRLPDGATRQIRLHTEGLWTMGQRKRKMDELAVAINQWHAR
jgi:hypothetical protein